MATMIGTGLVSGDSHVNEPRNRWRDNLPARFVSRRWAASRRATTAKGSL